MEGYGRRGCCRMHRRINTVFYLFRCIVIYAVFYWLLCTTFRPYRVDEEDRVVNSNTLDAISYTAILTHASPVFQHISTIFSLRNTFYGQRMVVTRYFLDHIERLRMSTGVYSLLIVTWLMPILTVLTRYCPDSHFQLLYASLVFYLIKHYAAPFLLVHLTRPTRYIFYWCIFGHGYLRLYKMMRRYDRILRRANYRLAMMAAAARYRRDRQIRRP